MSFEEWCQHYATLTLVSTLMGVCIMGYIVCIIIEKK